MKWFAGEALFEITVYPYLREMNNHYCCDRFSLSSSSSSELGEKLADKKPLELAAQRIDRAKVIYSTADDGDDRGGDGGGSKLSWVWSKVARLGRRLRPRW